MPEHKQKRNKDMTRENMHTGMSNNRVDEKWKVAFNFWSRGRKTTITPRKVLIFTIPTV